MRINISELNEQEQLITWWNDLLAIKRIPAHYHLICTDTAARRNKAQQARYKAMGGKAGTPDIFLAVSKTHEEPDGKYVYHGLWVEMKKPGREKEKDGGLTKDQYRVLKDMRLMGYATAICYTAVQAQEIISNYLGIKL